MSKTFLVVQSNFQNSAMTYLRGHGPIALITVRHLTGWWTNCALKFSGSIDQFGFQISLVDRPITLFDKLSLPLSCASCAKSPNSNL